MCNGHRLWELLALLMLFVCLQTLMVVLSLQQNSQLKICPFSCALMTSDFHNLKMHLRGSRHRVFLDVGARFASEAFVSTGSAASPGLVTSGQYSHPRAHRHGQYSHLGAVQPPRASWVAASQKCVLLHWQNTSSGNTAASVNPLCLHRHCQRREWSFLLKKNKLGFQFPVISF